MAPGKKNTGGDASSLFSARKYDRDAPAYAVVPSTEDVRGSLSSHLDLRSDEEGSDLDDDLTPHDLDVLKEEEETEKLLSKGGIFGSIGRGEGGVMIGKPLKGKRKKRRGLGHVRQGSGDSLVGVAEEGSYHDESEDEDIEAIRRERFDEKLAEQRFHRAPTIKGITVLSTLILSFLGILIYGAIRLSGSDTSAVPYHLTALSNGSHIYRPTTVYISLDGFRADYLARGLTPTIQSFINSGVSAPYLTPSFPSVTFPNHWTLVTGLYPESHGIVGNTFWDPESKMQYYYTKIESSTLPFWYGGNPIWSVAEENGIKTAIHMWPGSEQYIFHNESFVSSLKDFHAQKPDKDGKIKRMRPTFVNRFVPDEPIAEKEARILSWLDLPLEQRPQLIMEYVPNVDNIGHKFGPVSLEEDAELRKVDDLFRLLLEGLEQRNLTDIVNIVIVSDHGMTRTANERLIYLEDILDEKHREKISAIDGWPLIGLRPVDGVNITEMYTSIRQAHDNWPSSDSPTAKKAVITDASTGKTRPPWNAYLRDGDMPERFHFSHNQRIAPLWAIPEVGWVIVTKDEYPPDNFPKEGYYPKGVHGYDNLAKEMRAIFVARGPTFQNLGLHGKGKEWIGMDVHSGEEQEGPKLKVKGREPHLHNSGLAKRDTHGQEIKATKVKPFGNWEIYGLIGELLFGPDDARLKIGPHNGTFGIGGDSKGALASLELLTAWDDDADDDPTVPKSPGKPTRPVIEVISTPTAPAGKSGVKVGVDPPTTAIPTQPEDEEKKKPKPTGKPTNGDTGDDEDLENKPASMSWWEWAKYRAKKLKEKVEQWWGRVWDEVDQAGDKKGQQ